MAETYVTLHGLARAVTNLLQRTNTRTMFTAAHPLGEIIETTQQIIDMGERFRHSDRLRTYEFEVADGTPAAGRSIGELQFRQKTGATIVAVRKGEEILLSPGPQTRLDKGDVLVVACELAQVDQVTQLLGQPDSPDADSK